ncbi:MAG: hypothetical protein Q4B26_20185, partial [Eubacteriales bacterium]|nr:hypothetical protein [Eubacteriales bacterium]
MFHSKPENIFALDGSTDLIQLFDFDSLVSIDETAEFTETRITFSKGFSPVEQRLGDWNKIGKHSDIYSIGALLFYLIYGTPPKASDCNIRKPYDFSNAKFDFYEYPDSLMRGISDIFRGTLQSYVKDRCKDTGELLRQLENLEKLAEPSLEFVKTQIPSYQTRLIGREEELSGIEQWMKSDAPVLVITGMGGIGKSSIITESVRTHAGLFDAVSYLTFHGNLMETVADDRNLCLHNLNKDAAEQLSEYAKRKLAHLRKICTENKILLVIDNYEQSLTDELAELLDVGCKTILVSRQIETDHYPILQIDRIQKYEDRRELFLCNLGNWHISEKDEENISKIIDSLQGHTLSIELTAKQIQASYLSISEAAELIQERGFSKVGIESVLYEKDGRSSYRTIERIISSLYELNNLTAEQKTILKMLSFSDIRGVDARLFAELNDLESKEDVNILIRIGWISLREREVSLHPLICEVIRNTAWKENEINSLKNTVTAVEKRIEALSSLFTVGGEELLSCLEYARGILAYQRTKELIEKDSYDALWCYAAANLQRDDEEYILNCINSIDVTSVSSHRMLLKLWDISVKMLCEAGEYSKARKLIAEAGEYLQQTNADELSRAFFHGNIEGEYYDALIYDPEFTDQEERFTDCLLEANLNAIQAASVSDDERAPTL